MASRVATVGYAGHGQLGGELGEPFGIDGGIRTMPPTQGDHPPVTLNSEHGTGTLVIGSIEGLKTDEPPALGHELIGMTTQRHGGVADVDLDLLDGRRTTADALQPVGGAIIAAPGGVDDKIGLDHLTTVKHHTGHTPGPTNEPDNGRLLPHRNIG
ncbi:hypothetical protein AB0B50_14140 [Streptomyces sp. NPDC041068]|uniref:hypothetical protein n=1 Tax=Streptomyces sp. NPDC041068 TaxID=3155130 RepID=UPI00340C89E8